MDAVPKAQFPDEQSDSGHFVRQEDAFRAWVSADGQSEFSAEPGRYHLYVSWACPWAHRTIIFRHLKRLQDVIGMTVVDPVRDDRGWAFCEGPGHTEDPINGFKFLSEAYLATDPSYQGHRAGALGHANGKDCQ
jgi:putative glutathione S-transferase